MSVGRPLAVITGASSGIGAEFARQLAPRFDLLLVARGRERLERVRDQILPLGGRCELLCADLSERTEQEKVETAIHQSPHLELLVNNAGFGVLGNFADSALSDQERMHELHVMATLRLSHAALKGMMLRGTGGVINVSSISAFVPSLGNVSYSATKAWMNRFTEGLHLELKAARSAVKVQALCPGFTRTDFHHAGQINVSRIPSWMWMEPEPVVRASLEGLRRGKTIVIPGRWNQYTMRLYRMLPRRAKETVGLGSAAFRSREKSLPGPQ